MWYSVAWYRKEVCNEVCRNDTKAMKQWCKSAVKRHHTAGKVFKEMELKFPMDCPSRRTVYNWLQDEVFPTKEQLALAKQKKVEVVPLPKPAIIDLPAVAPIVVSDEQDIIDRAMIYAKTLIGDIQQGFIDTILSQKRVNHEHSVMMKGLATEVKKAIALNRARSREHDIYINKLRQDLIELKEDSKEYEEKRKEIHDAITYSPETPCSFQLKAVKSFGQARKHLTEGHKAFVSMAYDINLKFNDREYTPEEEDNNEMIVTVRRADIQEIKESEDE